MVDLGVAKPGYPLEDRAVIAALPTEFWARAAEIFFATIFSVALVWVVIRIWNGGETDDIRTDAKDAKDAEHDQDEQK
jgi:hypothetical protein